MYSLLHKQAKSPKINMLHYIVNWQSKKNVHAWHKNCEVVMQCKIFYSSSLAMNYWPLYQIYAKLIANSGFTLLYELRQL